MEEKIFQNEYTATDKLIKEYVYQILCKKIIFTGYIVFALGVILFFTLGTEMSYMVLTAGCISGVSAFLTPIITVKQLEENAKILNNGKIEKTYIQFSNNIIMNEGKVHLEFEYNQVNKILETKNFIVLKIGRQSAVLVFKEGFTTGNKEDFLTFVNNKM